MKKCKRCQRMLPYSEFNWKLKNIKLATYCKGCSRELINAHYQDNKKYYLDKAKVRNATVKENAQKYIWDYLGSHPCVDCGENDPIVLEFDHKSKETKINEISRIIKDRGVIRRLMEEVSKCEVRCANCHRRKTAKETNNWKFTYKRL